MTGTYRRHADHTLLVDIHALQQKTDLRSAQNLGHTDSICSCHTVLLL